MVIIMMTETADVSSLLVHVYWTALRWTDRRCIDTTIRISSHVFIDCEEIEVETRLLRMNACADVFGFEAPFLGWRHLCCERYVNGK